jgi:hypothetical protein
MRINEKMDTKKVCYILLVYEYILEGFVDTYSI